MLQELFDTYREISDEQVEEEESELKEKYLTSFTASQPLPSCQRMK